MDGLRPTAVLKKSQPTPGDAHVDFTLSNISLGFLQDPGKFVAGRVFQRVGVQHESNKYFTFDRGMFNRDQIGKRAPNAESDEVGYNISTDNYNAEVYAGHVKVSDQYRSNADNAIRPDTEATQLLSHQMLIRQEVDWASKYFVTGVWTTEVTGSAAPGAGEFEFWSADTSDPIQQIEDGKDAVEELTGQEPNILVVDRKGWGRLKNHPAIIARLDRGQTPGGAAMAMLEQMARLMELDEILVARSIRNTAAEGATNAHSYIMGDNALLCYRPPTPGLMTPAAGYTFAWEGLEGGAGGVRINRFREPLKKSDRLEIESAWDHKLVSADLGYFFLNVIGP